MIIQINTDNNITGSAERTNAFTALITDSLSRFSQHLSRIEVHFSDENSHKSGQNDIKCVIEARVEGTQPVAVTSYSNAQEQALRGALEKIKSVLTTTFDKLNK